MRSIRVVLWALTALAIGVLAGGFAGALHPLGDSLAVFRIQSAVAVLGLAALLGLAGAGRAALLAGATAALALPSALSYAPGSAVAGSGQFGIYQKNLNFLTGDVPRIAADIRESGADLVTLQEVSPRNRDILDLLADDYPVRIFCPATDRVGGAALLARWPADSRVEQICHTRGGMAAVKLRTPAGPVWAVSVHLHWPWPYRQAEQVREVARTLAGLDAPVIIAGDFNMVPWGHAVSSIGDAAGSAPVGPTRTSLNLVPGVVPLAIDHVLLPEGWGGIKESRPEFGSDHRGVLVRFHPDFVTASPGGS